jgi:hypothetical protein
MVTTVNTSPALKISKGRLWTARVMGGIVIAFMLMDGIFKFVPNEEAMSATMDLGYKAHHLPILGTLGLTTILLFAIPRTQILGAILLTAYFGGAIATHVRVDNPLFSHILFPVYLALLMWGSVWLRSERLRELVPFRK